MSFIPAEGKRIQVSHFRAVWRVALFGLLFVGSLCCYLLAAQTERITRYRPARTVQKIFCQITLKIFGVRVFVTGKPDCRPPVLWVANHQSYIDILVLSSLLEGSFVAKSEIASWPVIGYIARLTNTIFVERELRQRISSQREQLRQRLRSNRSVILFPEGTSSDGLQVLPFKSALFSAILELDDVQVKVYPVSIALVALDGNVPQERTRLLYSWSGEETLLPHAWRLLGLRSITLVAAFGHPIEDSYFTSRKVLAEQCWLRVSAGLSAASPPAGE